MRAHSRLVAIAAITGVVVAVAATGGPVPTGGAWAASREAPAAVTSPAVEERGRRLVERFLDLLVGEPDRAGLRQFLSPAFLRQGADGTSATKSEYLASTPAVLTSYEVRNLQATRQGRVLVVRYDLVTDESLGGTRAPTDPAPRLSVFVKGDQGWQIVAHANFNAPTPAPAS